MGWFWNQGWVICACNVLVHNIFLKLCSFLKVKFYIIKILFMRKIPLSPSSPIMYLNLFFSVREKKTPPPLHLGVCTIHLVAWLIDCYWRVGVNYPNCSRTQTPSVFTGLRNYWCQNQFIIPFTHRVGGQVKILNLSWIHSIRRFPVSLFAACFLQLFQCCHYFDRLGVWIGIVWFFSLLI